MISRLGTTVLAYLKYGFGSLLLAVCVFALISFAIANPETFSTIGLCVLALNALVVAHWIFDRRHMRAASPVLTLVSLVFPAAALIHLLRDQQKSDDQH